MKILLTGAQGQVGSEVLALGQENIYPYSRAELDITNLEALRQTFASRRPELVINAAAYTAVDKAEQERELAFAVNAEGVRKLALACKEYDLPLLHLSTDYVFDGEQEAPYQEEALISPLNVYGETKAAGEAYLQETWEKHLILRVSWVFGKTGANFVKAILRMAQKQQELRIVNDQRGCPTAASDIAATLLMLARKIKEGHRAWGVYHYRGERAVTWFEFAKMILEYGKNNFPFSCQRIHPILTSEYPRPAKRPQNSVLSVEKIYKEYGICPPVWERALAEMLK